MFSFKSDETLYQNSLHDLSHPLVRQSQWVLSRLLLVASGSTAGVVAGRINAALRSVSNTLGGVAHGICQTLGGIAESVANPADWYKLSVSRARLKGNMFIGAYLHCLLCWQRLRLPRPRCRSNRQGLLCSGLTCWAF